MKFASARRGCRACALASSARGRAVLAPPPQLGPDVQPFVHVPAGQIAITHVRIIDGTGAAPVEDATVLIDGAKIGAVQPAAARRSGGLSDASTEPARPRSGPRRHAQPPVLPRSGRTSTRSGTSSSR